MPSVDPRVRLSPALVVGRRRGRVWGPYPSYPPPDTEIHALRSLPPTQDARPQPTDPAGCVTGQLFRHTSQDDKSWAKPCVANNSDEKTYFEDLKRLQDTSRWGGTGARPVPPSRTRGRRFPFRFGRLVRWRPRLPLHMRTGPRALTAALSLSLSGKKKDLLNVRGAPGGPSDQIIQVEIDRLWYLGTRNIDSLRTKRHWTNPERSIHHRDTIMRSLDDEGVVDAKCGPMTAVFRTGSRSADATSTLLLHTPTAQPALSLSLSLSLSLALSTESVERL
jgi:hypothetical protein